MRCIKPASTVFNSKNFVEFDITDYALSEYQKNNRLISLHIIQNARASAGKGTSNFASKEHENLLKHPRILVELEDKPGVGINKISSHDVSVYPTLTNNFVYVTMKESSPILLINSTGTLLQTFTPAGTGEYKIDLNPYENGLYIVRVNDISYKVMKI